VVALSRVNPPSSVSTEREHDTRRANFIQDHRDRDSRRGISPDPSGSKRTPIWRVRLCGVLRRGFGCTAHSLGNAIFVDCQTLTLPRPSGTGNHPCRRPDPDAPAPQVERFWPSGHGGVIMAGQVQEIQHSLGVDFYEVVPLLGKSRRHGSLPSGARPRTPKKARFSNQTRPPPSWGRSMTPY